MRRIFWLLLLCGAICSAQTSTGGGQSGTGGRGGSGITSINADTTAAQTFVAGTNTTVQDNGGGSHQTNVASPGSHYDILCTGTASAFIACNTGVLYYHSGLFTDLLNIGTSSSDNGQSNYIPGSGGAFGTVAGAASIAAPSTVSTANVTTLQATPCSGAWTLTNSSGTMASTCTGIASTSTASDLVQANASGLIDPSFIGPIYTTPQTGVSETSGTGTITSICTSGVCTMASSGLTAGTYRLVVQILQTTTGSGGTCTTGTVKFDYGYKDADTGVTYNNAGTGGILQFTTITGLALSPNVVMIAAGNSGATNFISVPMTFKAATGVAITYTINQTAGNNCTTPTVFAVRPQLYFLGAL